MKRILQIALMLGASGPLFIGLTGFANGVEGFISAEAGTVQLDAHLRALSIWFTALFFIMVWCVRNLDEAGAVLRIMFVVMALAGVARLYSMWTLNEVDTRVVIAAVAEISPLIFIPWHAAYLRATRTQAAIPAI